MTDDNIQIARRVGQAFETGDTSTLAEFVAADVVDHNLPPGGRPGREGLADAVAFYASTFSDLKITADQAIAHDDFVAVTGTITGTNTGELMGWPPTGRPVSFAYMDMYRIADGMIVEAWHVEDVAALLAQLGHLAAALPDGYGSAC
jgi:predicted ester cyclase